MRSPDIDTENARQPVGKADIQERAPLVVILGPTAVGKTEVAIQLAERLSGEIVSADSRLFYRGLNIGTAKPSPQERARVPHHLVDVADPSENWSLAVFQRRAREAIAGIHARGRLPFLVGGTGQYVRAVIEGWEVPPVRPDPALRSALENWASQVGSEGLHARLAGLDPTSAAQIDHRNLRRTIRALEVIFSTGEPFSGQRRRGASPYRTLLLGLMRPRPELYARIDERIYAMIQGGFVDEVRSLLEQKYSPESPAFSAIGYREIKAYLKGETTLEGAVTQIKRLTRNYVRRQANWFREDDPDIHWFRVGNNTAIEMERTIRSWERKGFNSRQARRRA